MKHLYIQIGKSTCIQNVMSSMGTEMAILDSVGVCIRTDLRPESTKSEQWRSCLFLFILKKTINGNEQCSH